MKTIRNTKTIGDTCYHFPSKKFIGGKKPTLCKTSKYPRKTKEILIKKLRKWQNSAFLKLRHTKHFLIKAFCGSGKTTLCVVLSLWDLIKTKRKQLVIVPQSHLGEGFCISGVFNVPNLGSVHLSKPLNFCGDSENKTEMLVNFLTRDIVYSRSVSKKSENEYVVSGSNCIAVATHQCFVAAIDEIVRREKMGEKGLLQKCFNNLALYVDEAHHIKSGSTKEEENTLNNLGKILEVAMTNESCKIGLMTATFFRGDQAIIVSENHLNKFSRYEYEFLEHFKTLGIEKIFVKFEEYFDDPIVQIVSNVEKELEHHHLIIVPKGGEVGDKWRKHDLNLERLIRELKKMLEKNGIDPDRVILNLVDPLTQKQNKSILLKEPKESFNKDSESKIKIVITCMLGREGTDWCPCSRLHNASIELNSTTLAVQTLGRLFRKFENKTNVGITYYFKNFETLECSSKKREYISNRVNAMLALMIIDDLMRPILLPELPSVRDGIHRKLKRKKTKKIPLSKVYSHEDFEKIKKEILEIQSYQTEFDSESSEEIIVGVIKNYKKLAKVSDSDIIMGFKVFLLRARSETLRSQGIDIDYVRKNGFDEIVEQKKLKGNFWEGVLTGDKLKKFKEIIGKLFWTEDQKKEMYHNLINALSKKLGRKITNKHNVVNAQDVEVVRDTINDFCNFHEVYKDVAEMEKSIIPTQSKLAEKLKISTNSLEQKIKFLNQIPPEGYKFFGKKSKITEKLHVGV